MKAQILPFGGPAWDFRRELLAEIASMRPGPPYDYSDVLYLVPNSHAVATLQRMFLDALRSVHGVSGCIPPVMMALNGFVSRAAASVPGPPVTDPITRSLAIGSLTKSLAGKLDGHGFQPETLAGSVSGRVAERLEELETGGGVEALEALGSGRPLTGLLHDVGVAYRSWLLEHGLRDPYALRSSYSPTPEDFLRYNRVVLDGFYDADPVELRLMEALSGHPGCTFLVEAPGVSSVLSGEEGSPYASTKALFGKLGIKTPADPDPDAHFVTGALFGGVTLTEAAAFARDSNPLEGRVGVFEAEDEDSEIRHIAKDIKRSYMDGRLKLLSDAALFLPSADDYLQAVRTVFGDAGIPYRYPGGTPVSRFAPVRDAMGLLALPASGYRFAGIRAALSSPFFSFSPDKKALAAFTRHARREGITGGAANMVRLSGWLAELAPESGDSESYMRASKALEVLLELTAGFDASRRRLSEWAGMSLELLEGAGLPDTLTSFEETDPELGRAYAAFSGLVEEVRSASARIGTPVIYSEFLMVLRDEAGRLRLTDESDDRDAVNIVSRLQLNTAPRKAVYAAGLVESAMPAAPSPDPLIPERVAEELGLQTTRDLKDRDIRAIASIALSGCNVMLTYPRTYRSRAASPSPYVRALVPFTGKAVKVGRPGPEGSIGPADALSAVVSAYAKEGGGKLAEAIAGLPDTVPGRMRAIRSLESKEDGGGAPGYDPEHFTVTEIDGYLTCGWRYYQLRVLGLGKLEDPEEDFAPHMAGSAVHRVMHRFHDTAASPVTPESKDDVLGRLREIAKEEFSSLPETLRNMELKKRFIEDVAPRFIDSEAGRSESGYRTAEAEYKLSIKLEDGTVITGKIDRLDISEDGCFEVGDYKTGRYPTKPEEQFQLPVYAEMVKRDEGLERKHGGKLRPVSFVYYNLKGGETMRDVVMHESGKTTGKDKKSTEDIGEFTDKAMQRLAKAVSSIRSGVFEPDQKVGYFCINYCEFKPVCPKYRRDNGGDDDE